MPEDIISTFIWLRNEYVKLINKLQCLNEYVEYSNRVEKRNIYFDYDRKFHLQITPKYFGLCNNVLNNFMFNKFAKFLFFYRNIKFVDIVLSNSIDEKCIYNNKLLFSINNKEGFLFVLQELMEDEFIKRFLGKRFYYDRYVLHIGNNSFCDFWCGITDKFYRNDISANLCPRNSELQIMSSMTTLKNSDIEKFLKREFVIDGDQNCLYNSLNYKVKKDIFFIDDINSNKDSFCYKIIDDNNKIILKIK